MNIAAGVLLIIAAVINIIGGLGSSVAGAVVNTGADIVGEASTEIGAEAGGEAGAEFAAGGQEVSDGIAEVGALFHLYGYALYAVAALMIAGSVFLFKKDKAGFVLLVGILCIALELYSLIIIKSGAVPHLNAIGLVAGLLTIIASRSFSSAAAAA
jgi:hypothetical protein